VHVAGNDLGRQQQHQRVRDEDEQEAGDERERQVQGCHDRRQYGVEHRQQDRHEERGAGLIQRGAGGQRHRHRDGDRHDRQRDDEPRQPEAGPFGLPAHRLAVVGCGRRVGHASSVPGAGGSGNGARQPVLRGVYLPVVETGTHP
jgi:hypothetical protein